MAELMKLAYMGSGFAFPDGGGDIILYAAVAGDKFGLRLPWVFHRHSTHRDVPSSTGR